MEIINAMCLDYAIAVKQILANGKYKEMMDLNNCCKFYSELIG